MAPLGADQMPVREPASERDPGDGAQPIRAFMIADIRGYTLFTQERGDEAAAELAQRFEEIAREHVDARGGSVIEVRGDEALAVFRSSRQAIRAAVDLQSRFLEETREHPDLPLPVGIGLDAGEAVPVGDGYRGGALNLAARLCGEAGPGEILGSHGIAHLARRVDGVSFVDRGELHIKGLSDQVSVVAIASEDVDVARQMRPLVPRQPQRPPHGGRMQFRILGSLEVDPGGGPIPLGGPKQRAVLAHLLVRANELVPADALVEEIWGEDPPAKPRNTLQTYVSQLRKAVGHDRIQSQTPGYRLRLESLELDAERFGKLLADARKARAMAPGVVVSLLDEALELWRGPALSDVASEGSLLAEAARLNELKLVATEERIDAFLAIGEQGRVVGQIEALVTHNPLRERIWGQLMLALYREGRQADALNAYQRAREILTDELGIDPSPELSRLQERILRQDPTLELRGEPLRGYRLLEKIAEGPEGTVFRAIQPHVGRDVVVKIINEAVAADPGFIRRFEQEAQSVAALEHPHLVPVYDYWREPSGAYLVSRYLRGGNLRALQERSGLDTAQRARILGQLCSGLAFAHKQGVAHGNVKASDVLLDAEGNAYLGDFRIGVGPPPRPEEDVRGLARLVQGLFAADMPRHLAELTERAEVGADPPTADEFAEAARATLEPKVDRPPAVDARNPYKGLRPFTEADAGDFFGRGALVERVLDRMKDPGPGSRFIALVGPSGSGKSSVARAGLVPLIRRGALLGTEQDLFVAEMFPGSHPIEELESALLRIAVGPATRLRDRLEGGSRGLLDAVDDSVPGDAEVVLVIDQFEEVFTLTNDESEREQFLESLRIAAVDPESRLRIIVTLRADFFDRPLAYPRFGELLGSRTEVVPPLTPDEVEQAVRAPAEEVGAHPEPGLVAEMIADVANKPGALPLLQYALTELFERRDESRLTLDAYREIGGVAGALSGRAERLFEASSADGRRAIKQVFLRLVTLGEGRQDTRRRVARHELDSLGLDLDAIAAAVDVYGRHRLLTFDREPATREPTVEIAHEAMLGAWSRLRHWIDETREDLRLDRSLAAAAAEWRASNRDPSFVLQGTKLEQFETWVNATDLAIAVEEREFLKASLDRREHQHVEEGRRRAKEERLERRSIRRLRSLVALGITAALVASTLTVVAMDQRRRAEAEARASRARELAAAAVANLDVDPERSILLAMESVDSTRSVDGTVLPEAEEALHRAVGASRIESSRPGVGGDLDWSPRGVFATTGDFAREGPRTTRVVDIRDAETGKIVRSLPAAPGFVITPDLAFTLDGSMVATTGGDGKLRVWDPSTGDRLRMVSGRHAVFGPSFSSDGSLVAAVWGPEGDPKSTIRVVDLSTNTVLNFRGPPFTNAAALSPDGTRIALAGGEPPGVVWVIDISTGEVGELTKPGPFSFTSVAWSPDGRYIAAGGWDSTVPVWDARGELRFILSGHTESAHWVDWSPDWGPDSYRLVTGGVDETAKVWEITNLGAREVITLAAQDGEISGVAFSSDGTRVMTGSALSAVKMWNVGPMGDAEWGNLAGPKSDVMFTDVGEGVVASAFDGSVTKLDLETGRQDQIASFDPVNTQRLIHDLSPDGRSIAIRYGAYDDLRLSVRSVTTGEEMFAVGDRVEDVDWSPDGQRVAVAAFGSVTIYDRVGHEVGFLPATGSDVVDVQFGPGGRLIATTGADADENQSVKIWDWQRREVINELPVTLEAESAVFDPDGTRIATDRLEIWDVASEELIVRLPYAPPDVIDLAFSPDGTRLAVGSTDETVRLFDTESGEQVLVLRGHHGTVGRVVFSEDGSILASQADDGVRVWSLDIDDLLEIARQEVTRSLTDEECRQFHLDDCASA